jgi:hypothetical protein
MAQDKVKTQKFSVRALVEALEPERHERETVYEFSNGRKFKEKRNA